MELLKLIKERRSIRNYTNQMIDKEILDQLIEAALYAPSSHNSQPWHFTVIKNETLGKDLNAATKEVLIASDVPLLQKLGKRKDLFYGAPVIIVVSGKSDMRSAIIDCSAAVQNMILLAETFSLGSCWNGLVSELFMEYPEHPAVKALKIPEGYTPFYAVAIGYYDQKAEAPLRKGTPVDFIGF